MAFFLTLVLYIGLFLLSELLRPKPNLENAKPSGLGDFSVPTAEEGRAVPIIWGTVRLNGPNIGWYGHLRTEKIEEEVDTGLFSSEDVTVGYEYYLGIDFMLCRGEFGTSHNQGVGRIWVDDEELRPASAGWIRTGTITFNDKNFYGKDAGGFVGDSTLFPGSATQSQSSYMANLSEIDSTLLPNYRRTCHLVLEQIYVGNSPSLRPWAFELRRIPDGLGLGADAFVNSSDANPANVVYEIMTNSEWGLGLSNIDEIQMSAAGVTLAAEGNGYARILDRGIQAVELLAEIEQQVDGILVQDPVSKEWQLRLIRETDYPSPLSSLPQFDESNMLSFELSRGSWADTSNQVKIQYTDRSNNYSTTFAIAQDMANKIIQGDDDVIATQVYPAVQDATLANNIAWRDLRTLSYPLAKGKIKADRSNYTVRPGDLICINWPPFDITNLYARVNKISLGTAEANEIIYDWIEDIFRVEEPSFSDPTPTNWTPIVDEPVDVTDARVLQLPLGYQDVTNAQQYGVMAERANGAQQSYKIYLKEDAALPINVSRGGSFVLDGAVSPFTPTGLLDGALDLPSTLTSPQTNYIDAEVIINTGVDLDRVTTIATLGDIDDTTQPPNLAIVDDEIIFFESLTSLGIGQYRLNNVHRGMLDTAVQRHEDDAKVWFLSYGVGLIQTAFDPTTVGVAVWFASVAGGAEQGPPNGSPEVGIVRTVETTDQRYLGPSAPTNVQVDGVRLGNVLTLGDAFRVEWSNRVNSQLTRSRTNEDNDQTGTGNTYNVRVYHTGVSPEVEVYNVTGIGADATASPVGGEHDVSGYAVPFSPDASPWPSPQPFEQTYRLEIEAVIGSPEQLSGKWSRDFTRA